MWTSRLTGDQVAQVYPRMALEVQLSGEVVVRCTWSEGGRPVDCVLERESPIGEGFAEAGLALSKGLQAKAALTDGPPIFGRRYRLPIGFLPPSTRTRQSYARIAPPIVFVVAQPA